VCVHKQVTEFPLSLSLLLTRCSRGTTHEDDAPAFKIETSFRAGRSGPELSLLEDTSSLSSCSRDEPHRHSYYCFLQPATSGRHREVDASECSGFGGGQKVCHMTIMSQRQTPCQAQASGIRASPVPRLFTLLVKVAWERDWLSTRSPPALFLSRILDLCGYLTFGWGYHHVTQEQLHPLLVIAPSNPQARNEKTKYSAYCDCWLFVMIVYALVPAHVGLCCAIMVGWVSPSVYIPFLVHCWSRGYGTCLFIYFDCNWRMPSHKGQSNGTLSAVPFMVDCCEYRMD